MLIKTFRNDEFIDREEEISFLVDWFKETPKEILFYDPQTSTITPNNRVYLKAMEKMAIINSKNNFGGKYEYIRSHKTEILNKSLSK
ncbi:hypothetical protein [Hippea alviniae]|uniref:hypothetical protein n=1 Tax=Hippea alviniae TaxID=1279027 RepID=UPI0003B4AA3B|nr:hypothetical protein [Hippea alviniae]